MGAVLGNAGPKGEDEELDGKNVQEKLRQALSKNARRLVEDLPVRRA